MKWIWIAIGILVLVSSVSATTYVSQYPPAHNVTYVNATTTSDVTWDAPWFATNPAKSLTGDSDSDSWVSGATSNQRFHIDVGSSKIIDRIYYENYHTSGADTDGGVKNYTFWGSNASTSFLNRTYTNDTGWVRLTTNTTDFLQHASSDTSDPKYIDVTNSSIPYRYYAFKFANSYHGSTFYGVRRIELQQAVPETNFTINTSVGIAPTDIVFNDTSLNNPTSWNWTYTNTTPGNNTEIGWSTSQNTTRTFGVGNWLIKLNASNSAGYNISSRNITVISPTTWTYSSAGTFYWVCPAGLTSITLQYVGGGGGGASGYFTSPNVYYGEGGNAAPTKYSFNVATIPGTNYTIVVGTGGIASGSGLPTSFSSYSTPGGTTGSSYVTWGHDGGDGADGLGTGGNAQFGGNATYDTTNYGGYPGVGYGAGGGGGAAVHTPGSWWAFGAGGVGSDGYLKIYRSDSNDTPFNQPNFVADVTIGSPGQMVRFTDTSSILNTTGLEYNWSFGDGGYSSVIGDVIHVYPYLGSFDVSLSITNGDGIVVTENKISYINIINNEGTTTFFVPKPVSLTVVSFDPAGVIVPNASVYLNAIGNTLQADSQIQTLYGVNALAANELMNGTLIMHGNTDNAGAIVFTVLSTISYHAVATDPTTGTNYTATLNPGMDPYTLWIGTNPIKNITIPNSFYMNQTRLFVTQPDVGNITDNLIYIDLAGKTTSVTFKVKYASNGSVAYTATQAVTGTNPVYMNYTHPNIRGMGFFYGWNATKVL